MPIDAIDYISPKDYFIVIEEIIDKAYEDIGYELERDRYWHLREIESWNCQSLPVRGILYGNHHRIFLPLGVKEKEICRNVFFLLDPLSPYTYLCENTFNALEIATERRYSVHVSILDTKISVYLSNDSFKNINVLGYDFLRRTGLKCTLDYNELTAKLS